MFPPISDTPYGSYNPIWANFEPPIQEIENQERNQYLEYMTYHQIVSQRASVS